MTDIERSDLHKHLEFIQNVIARLANNSFLMKGWAITVSGAFYGFGVQQESWELAAIGLVPAFAFWRLDAYFLRAETMFRCLFNSVRLHPETHQPFDMDHRAFESKVNSTMRVMLSETLRYFHGVLVVVGTAITLAIACVIT